MVWTVPSPWAASGLQVLPIQSLHLAGRLTGLGSGLARQRIARAFPEFEQIRHVVSRRDAQLKTRNPVLYPAELRGHTRIV